MFYFILEKSIQKYMETTPRLDNANSIIQAKDNKHIMTNKQRTILIKGGVFFIDLVDELPLD